MAIKLNMRLNKKLTITLKPDIQRTNELTIKLSRVDLEYITSIWDIFLK